MWLDINAVATGEHAPTYEDLEKLTYLKQVVKEVLRLYPAIPMFPREASMDDILPTGHRVDAGALVLSPVKLK
jgi:cytochrome P450